MKLRFVLLAGVSALSCQSAMAQEATPATGPLCAGFAAAWMGGSAEAAVLGAESAPLVQQASAPANVGSLLAFRVDGSAQDIRIEAAATMGDPMITLTTSSGATLIENDDYGGTLNAQAVTRVEPGDYCIRLSAVGGDAVAATVQVSRTDQLALLPEAVDTTLTECLPSTQTTPFIEGPLNAALANGRVSQNIGAGAAYLRFDLAEPASVTLRAESELLDPQIKLFDGAGVLVAENDDADGLNARLDFLTALPAGSYCMAAGPLSSGEGTVVVSVETLDKESYLLGAWQRGELAPPEGGTYPIQAIDLAKDAETMLLHDGAAQWLAFDLATETVLVVKSFGQISGVDTRLTLFGEGGIPVQTADDSETSTDAQLGPVVLKAGRYRLAVMDIGGVTGAGGPIRPIGIVFERFVRVK